MTWKGDVGKENEWMNKKKEKLSCRAAAHLVEAVTVPPVKGQQKGSGTKDRPREK